MLEQAHRLTVVELHRALALGSSQPWVASASDGHAYVVKFAGAGPGSGALLAELIVNRLAASAGMAVTATAPIWLPAPAPRVGTDELWDVLDASLGWNLAIELVADAVNVDLSGNPTLDASTVAAIAIVDSLFRNLDRTTISNNLIVDGDGKVWLIDHGSCLFLPRLKQPRAFELAENHFLFATDPRQLLHTELIPRAESVGDLIGDIPAPWLEDAGWRLDELVAALTALVEDFRRWAGA